MGINEKLKKFEQSIKNTSNDEYEKINENVEEEIKNSIEQEIQEYEEKKYANYLKNVQKIEKDFNKKVFNYEMNSKKQIIDEGNRLREMMKDEAILKLKDFTNNEKYEKFLFKSIDQGFSKMDTFKGTCIGITKKDIEKYQKNISQKYNLNIKEIEDKYIGGCILENNEQGIIIDNTLLNMIDERLKG